MDKAGNIPAKGVQEEKNQKDMFPLKREKKLFELDRVESSH